ncbi:MAG: TolB family protein [Thermoleophilia bacterium]
MLFRSKHIDNRKRLFALILAAAGLLLIIILSGSIGPLALGEASHTLFKAKPGVIESVSVDVYGNVGTGGSTDYSVEYMAISADGRFVAFESQFTNLVADDTNNNWDVFIRDTQTDTTQRVSTDANGNQANGLSGWPDITPDGSLIAFSSNAPNLVPGDTNQNCGTVGCDAGWGYDIFVKNPATDAIERVSTNSSDGQVMYGNNRWPSISADGRYVVFESTAQIDPIDSNYECLWGSQDCQDIYLKDRVTGDVLLVSKNAAGTGASNKRDAYPSISDDGRYIMFESNATDLVEPATNGKYHVYVYDRVNETMELVSSDAESVRSNGDNYAYGGSISPDGHYVVFSSTSTNLVAGYNPSFKQIYRKDRWTGNVAPVSSDKFGGPGDQQSEGGSISQDGRYVAFQSEAGNLVHDDAVNCQIVHIDGGTWIYSTPRSCYDIFVKDLDTGNVVMTSTDAEGVQGSSYSMHATISANGMFVTFWSAASNLVANDTNSSQNDVFLARVPSCGTRPDLRLRQGSIYWSSYAAYLERNLSVDFRIVNSSEAPAENVSIYRATASHGVTTSSAPVDIGLLTAGESGIVTIEYDVPMGVTAFKTSLFASATDGCGNSFGYP